MTIFSPRLPYIKLNKIIKATQRPQRPNRGQGGAAQNLSKTMDAILNKEQQLKRPRVEDTLNNLADNEMAPPLSAKRTKKTVSILSQVYINFTSY